MVSCCWLSMMGKEVYMCKGQRVAAIVKTNPGLNYCFDIFVVRKNTRFNSSTQTTLFANSHNHCDYQKQCKKGDQRRKNSFFSIPLE